MLTNLGPQQIHYILIHGISMCIQHLQVYWELLNLLSVNCICFFKERRIEEKLLVNAVIHFMSPRMIVADEQNHITRKSNKRGKKLKPSTTKFKMLMSQRPFEKE